MLFMYLVLCVDLFMCYVRMFSLCYVRIFRLCYVRFFESVSCAKLNISYVRFLGAGSPLRGSLRSRGSLVGYIDFR